MQRIVIGIAGGTGSGKTTIAKKLMENFGSDCLLLSHDYYYKPNEEMSFEERAAQNYDHPNSLDTALLVEHIRKLKRGEKISHPTYEFATYSRNEVWEELLPTKIILVEGILIFENKQVCDLCDIKIFVDTDDDVRFIRRLRRDVFQRGRSMESVITQWLTTVKPMHDRFVFPSKRNADIIIPEGGHNVVAIDTVISGIKSKIDN